MKTLIKNIGELFGIHSDENPLSARVAGKNMAELPSIKNAYIICNNNIIEEWGTMADLREEDKNHHSIDAENGMLWPAWCDSHTHLIFAAARETEFVDRIKGLSYVEIAEKGGGILNSATRLNTCSEAQLLAGAKVRLQEIISFGTGAVEIKSGYGLSLEGELKMLRVAQQLKAQSPIDIKVTFLGAHAVPAAYKQNRAAYIRLIKQEMLPAIGAEKLADYCDVFCDKGFFTPEETDTILEAAWKYGLQPKIHANELDFSGGIQVGVKHRALSVDHLECTGAAEIDILLKSDTMPTLLPSTAFFLGLHYPPARTMIDAGLPLALATDYNPGSSPSGNMSFIVSLACIKMKMLPEEALWAATLNGAYAMGLANTHGSISKGKKANFIISKAMPSLAYLPYRYGNSEIKKVIIEGKLQHENKL